MSIDLKTLTKNKARKPIIVLHGPEGIGKTVFAACAPNPIFLVTEDGLGDIPAFHLPQDKPKFSNFKEIMEAISDLYVQDHEFKTVVLDSLDKLEPIIWKETCDRFGESSIEDIKGGYGKGYGEASKVWMEFYDGITALRDKKGMYVILIAHSQIRPVKDPTQPEYEKYVLNLNKLAMAIFTDLPDVVGFASWRIYTTKEKGEDRHRAGTTGERMLYVGPKPYHSAKNRFHMVEEMELSWKVFESNLPAEIRGSTTNG